MVDLAGVPLGKVLTRVVVTKAADCAAVAGTPGAAPAWP